MKRMERMKSLYACSNSENCTENHAKHKAAKTPAMQRRKPEED